MKQMIECISPILNICLIIARSFHNAQSYTYEPPGRDPVSIDKIRSSEKGTILTTDNYDDLTSEKLVFIKFYAPYCPHCNAMAKAWNELADYYDRMGNGDVLIGSVDCTDSPKGKNLCMRFQLTGLPTLLYGTTSYNGVYLEEYGGGKSYEELKSFASNELVPKCLPGSMSACTTEERTQMETYLSMSHTELNEKIQSLEKQLQEAKETFKEKKGELQKYHDKKLSEKELNAIRIKKTIKIIQGVREKLAEERTKSEL